MANWEKSCGAVIFARRDGTIKYLLVRQRKGFYGFPKGHMEGSETEHETARREIWEEVGLRPGFIDGFRATDQYPVPKKRDTMKEVVFFLAEYDGSPVTVQASELLGYTLAPYAEARELLGYEGSKRVLDQARAFLKENRLIDED